MNYRNVYDITIQQMETCVLAAATGSFTGVADSLYMTQSAVSKQIKNVEDRIGLVLFVRGRGAGLSLTPAGSVLVTKWREIIKNYNTSLIDAENAQNIKQNSIIVAVQASLNTSAFLVPAIRAFENSHPNCEVHIDYLSPEGAKQSLMKGRINLVFFNSYRKDLFLTENFDITDVLHCHWQIGMFNTNLLSCRKVLEWQNLRNQKMTVVNDYVFMKMLTHYCNEAGFEPKISYANTTFSGIADNIKDDRSVFLIDPYMNDYGKEGFSYFEMKNAPVEYCAVLKSSETNPLITDFVKHLKNYAKENYEEGSISSLL